MSISAPCHPERSEGPFLRVAQRSLAALGMTDVRTHSPKTSPYLFPYLKTLPRGNCRRASPPRLASPPSGEEEHEFGRGEGAMNGLTLDSAYLRRYFEVTTLRGLAREHVHRGAMHRGVAGGEHGAGGVHVEVLAVPVGDDTASALDDRHEGGEVVELQAVLDHEVDMARGEQAVGIAVAAPAEVLHLFRERLVASNDTRGFEHLRRGRIHVGIG